MKLFSTKRKYVADSENDQKEKTQTATAARKTNIETEPTASDDQAMYVRKNFPSSQREEKKKPSNIAIWRNATLIFCTIMALTFLFFWVRKIRVESEYRNLLEKLEVAETGGVTEAPYVEQTTANTYNESVDQTESTQSTEPLENGGEDLENTLDAGSITEEDILPKYKTLYNENNELFGWICLNNTKVNYPVMQSPGDNEKYLHTDFYEKKSSAGVPYADMMCNRNSDNILIYGHCMRDGTMFTGIMKYERKSFWKKNPTFMFSDLTEDYSYEVLAAFYDRVYLETEDVFKFYQFIDADNKEDFDYAISQFKEKSLYDTGVDAQYGDKLVTLITCAYHVTDGRFVVVARRIEN